MLGYMTARQARAAGFTHHGKYFGVPIWIGDLDSFSPVVAAKWAPMEAVMTLFHHIEATLHALRYPDHPPVFQFWIGQLIDIEDKA
ncbi:hypothetical protein MBSD_n1567 [Mizugakiibacter sediminis]|uniref:Uncharacterized protein n=1 Tax=Mizugakiibacter sediminis TaxID=1475481 RepID=A0A0K8QN26_9GAMM|nr:hypothetical protein [Mizugakiibacter sediminis]GAP66263.1 hypothetical protein MBSD_n1567 [Mizugakiibacter sediminis]